MTLLRIGSLIAIALGLFAIVIGVTLLYASLSDQLAHERADRAVHAQAREVSRRLSDIQSVMNQRRFIEAAAAGPASQGELTSREFLGQFDIASVINVYTFDDEELVNPPETLDAELIALLLEVVDRGLSVVRVDRAGTPRESLAMAVLLTREEGLMLMQLPVSVLTSPLRRESGIDHLMLIQSHQGQRQVLWAQGATQLPQYSQVAINDTELVLEWHRSAMVLPLSDQGAIILASTGLIVLCLGLLMRRRFAPAVIEYEPEEESELIYQPEEPKPTRSRRKPRPYVPPATPAAPAADRTEVLDPETLKSPAAVPDLPDWLADADYDSLDDLESAATEEAPPPPPAQDAPAAADDEDEEDWGETLEDIQSEPLDAATLIAGDEIRGNRDNALKPALLVQTGMALAESIRDRGGSAIALAHDGPPDSSALGQHLAEGLSSGGLQVIDIGLAPLPVLYLAATQKTEGNAVMITRDAGHPEFAHLRILHDGSLMDGAGLNSLLQRAIESDAVQSEEMGKVVSEDWREAYIKALADSIRLERPLKVVIDCGNGLTGLIASDAFDAIGAEVISLYTELEDGQPNHPAEPWQPNCLEDLSLCVKNFEADLGLAFDDTGSALGMVAPDGTTVWPDDQLMLLVPEILERRPAAAVLVDIDASPRLERMIEQHGGGPFMVHGDRAWLHAELRRTQAGLAGDFRGHLLIADAWHGLDDAVHAGARLLARLAADERPVSEQLAEVRAGIATGLITIDLGEQQAETLLEKLAEHERFDEAEFITSHCLRLQFDDGWGLIRLAGTQALTARFEADHPQALARIQAVFQRTLGDIAPSIQHPF